jgi:hypothetical protein
MHGKKMNAYRIWVAKPERTIPLGRIEHRWEDSIKKIFDRMVWYGLD